MNDPGFASNIFKCTFGSLDLMATTNVVIFFSNQTSIFLFQCTQKHKMSEMFSGDVCK
jgi:hypothetical protein